MYSLAVISLLSFLADSPPSTVAVYLSFVVGLVGILVTFAGVYYTYTDKKRELEISENTATVDELKEVRESLVVQADRWEAQAREAWREIDALKEQRAKDAERIFELERSLRVVTAELAEEKRRSMKCMERLERLDGKDTQ